MQHDALLIFVKNPVLGSVKTRLAASLGDVCALEVYQHLLKHTLLITRPLTVTKLLFYAGFLETEDQWDARYQKHVQEGRDLGERMKHAFHFAFSQGFQKVVIIGSDCLELSTPILEQAFEKLDTADIVIGPATDGGYYLLGMKALHPSLFKDIAWSTDSVLKTTMARCREHHLQVSLLVPLSDIDEEKDLALLQGRPNDPFISLITAKIPKNK